MPPPAKIRAIALAFKCVVFAPASFQQAHDWQMRLLNDACARGKWQIQVTDADFRRAKGAAPKGSKVLDLTQTTLAAFVREHSNIWVGKSTVGCLGPSSKVLASS